ncbi:hypothetical protein GOP47_0003666 [Adiantum capillus-veneris]|uniref:Uncharacterized protein n=1 Tax=Adiantum capillus-veneris TaxID=13818 RepID=A0A9D4ZLW0_ADICA|nr:hypothetical protein GOP47_0003666 [Adiantum capillus-veneris]
MVVHSSFGAMALGGRPFKKILTDPCRGDPRITRLSFILFHRFTSCMPTLCSIPNVGLQIP